MISKRLFFSGVILMMQSLAVNSAELLVKEHLGRTWSNEVVTFDITDQQRQAAASGYGLLDGDGNLYRYQLLAQHERLAVLLDLRPHQLVTLQFTDEAVDMQATDVTVERTADAIRMTTDKAGIALRTSLAEGKGPLLALRTSDGRWMGGSRLSGVPEDLTYTVETVLDGPIIAETVCTLTNADGETWKLRFRLQAGEPVVTVSEEFSTFGRADLDILLSEDFEPDMIFHRYGKSADQRVGYVAATSVDSVDGSTKFVLEPWIHWWERTTQGNWFGLYEEATGPMIVVGAYQPSLWVDPAQPRTARQFAKVPLVLSEQGDLNLHFKGENSRRAWMIGAMPADVVSAVEDDEGLRQTAPPPQQYLIKHGHFPLDTVHNWVLNWESSDVTHPYLFMAPETLEDFRERYEPNEAELKQALNQPIRPYQFDNIFYHYLGTGNEELENKLIDAAVSMSKAIADRIYQQDDLVYYGFAPHHQNAIRTSGTVADLILSSDKLTEQQRQEILANMAFIGYAVSTPDYWSPERGFAANPNMTTFASTYQVVCGALLRGHPESQRWLDTGMSELERQIKNWSGPNGGWLEAPHYCLASYNPLVAYFLMSHLAGQNDLLFDEKTKKVALWLAKIATPPDARIKGWRHNPPIGNTYKFEPCGQFGTMAALWRENDPELAAEMQWMHEQHGAPATPGVGGFFAALAGYQRIYQSIEVPSKAPAWGSELFPNAGAVLRAHFPSDRETMLYMIGGPFHDHYDKDSGSITLWGKGRIIADDFGYQGNMPAADHSMLESPLAVGAHRMSFTEFETTDGLDYVAGEKNAWQRQVVLVKDPDPVGQNFIVINDTLDRPAEAAWRLWLTAENVAVNSASKMVEVTGKEDVNTSVHFVVLPKDADITINDLTRETWGLNSEGRYGRTSSTQTGLSVAWKEDEMIMAVVYPRLEQQQVPEVTSLADGAGVKVKSALGTDYVFLSREVVDVTVDGIVFRGTVGSVQLRADAEPRLFLAGPGVLTFNGKRIERQ